MSSDPRVEIDQITIGIAEVDGTGAPRLRGGRFDPISYDLLEPGILLIDITHFKLQNRTLVFSGSADRGMYFS